MVEMTIQNMGVASTHIVIHKND